MDDVAKNKVRLMSEILSLNRLVLTAARRFFVLHIWCRVFGRYLVPLGWLGVSLGQYEQITRG